MMLTRLRSQRPRVVRDEGSITVWTLGMVLIVMMVGALSFGLWSGFSARRELAGAADQAAQAGANALDESFFRSTGLRRLDPARAEDLAVASLRAQDLADGVDVVVEANDERVRVELRASVDAGLLGILDGGEPLVVRVESIGQPQEVLP